MNSTGEAFEVNFDGLVGPTHHYGGLSYGNIAAERHKFTVSNPREALKQGLKKMKLLADMGLKQAVLPPHERPDIRTLRRLGYQGSEPRILETVAREEPLLLAACYSSASMWAANGATVSPSADAADARVHFTPANLVSQFHRSIETKFTAAVLKAIFKDDGAFAHHPPLPASVHYSDDGAANHTRLCGKHGQQGVEFFVYGRKAFEPSEPGPVHFPARQTLEASQAIVRLHGLDPTRTVFAKQNPDAIDEGVFHNDVISVGNETVFIYHSDAFSNGPGVLEEVRRKFETCCDAELFLIEVGPEQVSVQEAVDMYLFNSQIVTLPGGGMCIVAPIECEQNSRTRRVLEEIVALANPIRDVLYVDLRQSMKNGGGPACVRLRVVLTPEEMSLTHQAVYLTNQLYEDLNSWGDRYYRDRLTIDDLSDPHLPEESRAALDALTQILKLGSIYLFQKA
jgi:succinylarginine dihydrolase